MSRNGWVGVLIAVFIAALALAYGFGASTLLGSRKDEPRIGDTSGPTGGQGPTR